MLPAILLSNRTKDLQINKQESFTVLFKPAREKSIFKVYNELLLVYFKSVVITGGFCLKHFWSKRLLSSGSLVNIRMSTIIRSKIQCQFIWRWRIKPIDQFPSFLVNCLIKLWSRTFVSTPNSAVGCQDVAEIGLRTPVKMFSPSDEPTAVVRILGEFSSRIQSVSTTERPG